MINDSGFQLRFAEKSEEKILKWCKMQQRYFRLNVSENNTIRIYPCSVDVEPCSLYWRRSRCKKGKCGKFHIIKRLMLGEIHNHKSCTQNHSFESMSTTEIVIISKTKMSAPYWRKGPSLGTYLVESVSCPLEGAPTKKRGLEGPVRVIVPWIIIIIRGII